MDGSGDGRRTTRRKPEPSPSAISTPADEAMRLLESARAMAPSSRGEILRRAVSAAREAFDEARGAERARAAAIAANACYQLSFTVGARVAALAWLRLATSWGERATEGHLPRANPFASFHARMFAAQALVRAATIAPWRRAANATRAMVLYGDDAGERSPYPLAPLFRLAAASALRFMIESSVGADDAEISTETRLEILELPIPAAFEKQMPIEAAEIAMLAARERLRRFERGRSNREHARAIASCLHAFFRIDFGRRGSFDLDQLVRVERETAIVLGRAIALEPSSGADPQALGFAVDAARGRKPRVLATIAAAAVDAFATEPRRSLLHLDRRLAKIAGSGPLRDAIAAKLKKTSQR